MPDHSWAPAPVARILLVLGALAGLAGVALSAWAAHGAPRRLDPASLEAVRAAVGLLGWHAPALLAAGLWAGGGGGRLVAAAGLVMAAGLALFCGAVLLGALADLRAPGVAPAGGTLLLAAWGLLLAAGLRRRG